MTAALPPLAQPDPNRIGVVFVHGVGSQRAGQTLLEWSRPLIQALADWREERGTPANPVVKAQIDFSGATFPLIELDVPAIPGHAAQRWLLTEAWWASDLEPPGAGQMGRWVISEVGRVLGRFGNLYASIPDVTTPWALVWQTVERWLVRVFIPLVGALVIVVLTVAGVVRQIPVRAVRDFVGLRMLDLWLVNEMGDGHVLVADRPQSANIRNRVASALRALEAAGCGSAVVIGHSGGSIISYMTLTDPAHRDVRVNKLITLGQAVGLAWKLGRVDEAARPCGSDLRSGDPLAAKLGIRRPTLRWIDFWSTHDPAPAGELGEGSFQRPTKAHRVHNRMSVRRDHDHYWNNDEEFVFQILRHIDQPRDEHPSASRFHTDAALAALRSRRAGRVRNLAGWWYAWMASLGVGLLGGVGMSAAGGSASGLASLGMVAMSVEQVRGAVERLLGGLLPDDLQSFGPTLAAGIVIAVLLFVVMQAVAIGQWDRWDVAERCWARRQLEQAQTRASRWSQGYLFAAACVALAGFCLFPSLFTLAVAAGLAVLGLAVRIPPVPGRADTGVA